MRILFLTQVLPYPLDAGPKVRAYYVLRHLAERHEVTLVSFVRMDDTPEAVAHLRTFCRQVYTTSMQRGRWRDAAHLLRSLPSHKPFIIARDETRAMAALLARLVEQDGPFDAVHADQLWMAPYALQVQAKAGTRRRPVAILDQHNAVYLIPQRMSQNATNPLKRLLLDTEAHKLAQYEVSVCTRFDHVVWVTHEDFAAVRAQANGAGAHVRNSGIIPICVDAAPVTLARGPQPRRVTFLGGMHYPPNAEGVIWFARHVFPAVLAAVPDAVLTLVGKQPPALLTQLGLPAANLEMCGYVADPAPYLAETAAFIVPLHAGGGMRVKILDAWRWGLPMVSTTVGAEGIQVTPGEDILLADAAECFADATIHLLNNPQAGRQMAGAGQKTLTRHYNWRTVYPQWNALYA